MIKFKQRKEMRIALKKRFMLDQAALLFWQKGYHDTNMMDIAGACGCKPANMYHYFMSKEDILFEVIKEIIEQTVGAVKHLEDDETTSPPNQIKALVRGHYELLTTRNKSNLLLPDTSMRDLTAEHQKVIIEIRDKYDAILRKVLRRGIKSGDFANLDVPVVGYFISSMIIRSNIWFSPNGRLSPEEIVDTMFNFIYVGIKSRSPRSASAT